jgi:hypothetical protein
MMASAAHVALRAYQMTGRNAEPLAAADATHETLSPPRPLVRRYRGLYAERRMGHERSVRRYDDGCPVITNEKVASLSVDRLRDDPVIG